MLLYTSDASDIIVDSVSTGIAQVTLAAGARGAPGGVFIQGNPSTFNGLAVAANDLKIHPYKKKSELSTKKADFCQYVITERLQGGVPQIQTKVVEDPCGQQIQSSNN